MTDDEANMIKGSLYFISACVAPLLGLMMDKVGRNIFWLFLAVLAALISQCILLIRDDPPVQFQLYIGLLLRGGAYGLLTVAIWPLVALKIPSEQLGTAYGLLKALMHLGTALFTIAAHVIKEESTDKIKVHYVYVEVSRELGRAKFIKEFFLSDVLHFSAVRLSPLHHLDVDPRLHLHQHQSP